MKIAIYDVLKSIRDKATNYLYAQVGDAISKRSAIDDVESGFGPFGIAGMPPDGAEEDSAEALVYENGNTGYILGYRYLKGLIEAGKLTPGEMLLFNAFGCKIYLKKTGTITLLVPEDDGAAMTLSLGNTCMNKKGIEFRASFGVATYTSLGLHIKDQSGAEFHMGGIGGLPAPLDVVGSYATIKADLVNVQGTTTQIGVGEVLMPCTFTAPLPPGTPVPIASSFASTVFVATGA